MNEDVNDEGREKCPRCGAPMPPDAPGDLCPRCLLALPLERETIVLGPGGESAGGGGVPEIDAVQAHFPQLEILECLGRGGMGVVFKARQKSLNRMVALKLLAPERAGESGFAERFQKEAHALAALSHPNIVTIHDFGEVGGFFFLLMEFVDGVNLRQAMNAGKFTPEEALAIVPPVCEALQYAHEHGIIHRDIKPENLLLDREGRVKIADFGVAKMVGAKAAVEERVSGGGVADTMAAGTPRYMAPEQMDGPGPADHRVDIYAMGVVLYELLTGEVPVKGEIAPPSKRVDVDVRIDEIVLRALEEAPEMRYATAAEFRTRVEGVSTEGGGADLGSAGGAAMAPTKVSDRESPVGGPRLSRAALWGLIWIGLLLGAVPTVLLIAWANDGMAAGTVLKVILMPIMLVAATAPVGATVLGWVGVTQIRRSRGRLYGLGLAVCDGLLFPMLLLNAAIVMAFIMTIRMAYFGHSVESMLWLFWVAGVFLMGLNVLIVWLVWRAVKRGLAPAEGGMNVSGGGGEEGGEASGGFRNVLGVVGFIVAGMAGVFGLATFATWSNPADWLSGAIIGCGAMGVVLGIIARRSAFGRWAIVVGGVNLLIAVVVAGVVVVEERMEQNRPWAGSSEAASARFEYRVFVVDAPAADAAIPKGKRWGARDESDLAGLHNYRESEMARVNHGTLHELMGEANSPWGLLKDDGRRVSAEWWNPGLETSWRFGPGSGDLEMGYLLEDGEEQVRVVGSVAFSDAGESVRTSFAYAGRAPGADGAFVVLLPFTDVERGEQYLVFALTVTDQRAARVRYYFGSTIGAFVPECAAPRYEWFDLESGDAYSMEDTPGFEGRSATVEDEVAAAWKREHGIDFAATLDEGSRGLVGIHTGFRGVRLKANQWDKMAAPDVVRLMEEFVGPEGEVFLGGALAKDLPAVYAFRTREGGVGLLKIVAVSEEPRGVELRYKFVEGKTITGTGRVRVVGEGYTLEADEVTVWPGVSEGPGRIVFLEDREEAKAAETGEAEFEMPKSASKAAVKAVEVRIRKVDGDEFSENGHIMTLDGERLVMDELRDALESLSEEGHEIRMAIWAGEDVSSERVAKVLDMAGDAGVVDVKIMVMPPEEDPSALEEGSRWEESAVLIDSKYDRPARGFLAKVDGRVGVVTNLHVLAVVDGLKAMRATGETLRMADRCHLGRSRDMGIVFVDGVDEGLTVSNHRRDRVTVGDEVEIWLWDGEQGPGVREGVISLIEADSIQVTAPFKPGESGSPIVHKASGNVLAIVSRIESPHGPREVQYVADRIDDLGDLQEMTISELRREDERIMEYDRRSEAYDIILSALRKKGGSLDDDRLGHSPGKLALEILEEHQLLEQGDAVRQDEERLREFVEETARDTARVNENLERELVSDYLKTGWGYYRERRDSIVKRFEETVAAWEGAR